MFYILAKKPVPTSWNKRSFIYLELIAAYNQYLMKTLCLRLTEPKKKLIKKRESFSLIFFKKQISYSIT